MKALLVALMVVVSGYTVTGCATVQKILSPTSPYSPLVQAGVDVAVGAAIQKGVAPAQIKAIAQTALAADSGATATVAAVSQVVNQQLAKLGLNAADAAAAQLLVSSLESAMDLLLTSPSNSGTVNNVQVAIAEILNDVITAASAYGV